VRVNAAINAATNAFLRWALGPFVATETTAPSLARLVGLMEMPKPETKLTLDIASLVGVLFYTWLLQLLLPVMLATLVAEKEGRLRTMMKMHGLGDGAYWAIQYGWYFALNLVYVWVLIGAGSAIGRLPQKLTPETCFRFRIAPQKSDHFITLEDKQRFLLVINLCIYLCPYTASKERKHILAPTCRTGIFHTYRLFVAIRLLFPVGCLSGGVYISIIVHFSLHSYVCGNVLPVRYCDRFGGVFAVEEPRRCW
jgi:hypothetical protein